MHRALIFAIAALAPLCAAAGERRDVPSDEVGFTAFVAGRMRQAVGDTPVSVKEPLTLAVGPLQVNLGRVHAFCRRDPDRCAAELDTLVGGVQEALRRRKAPLEKPFVRVVVREAAYARRAQESFGADAPALLVEPLTDAFTVMLVADTPRNIEFLDERAMAELGLSRAAMFQLGRANVRAELKPLGDVAKPVRAGEIGTIRGSVYEVGRVALHEEWERLAKAQGGALLVAMPATDVVMYASEDTPLAVAAVRTIARQVMDRSANPLSAEILRWTPEGWRLVR